MSDSEWLTPKAAQRDTVGSLIPGKSFAAMTRIFHPVRSARSDEVSWSRIAEEAERTLWAGTQYVELLSKIAEPADLEAPLDGSLGHHWTALVDVLRPFTSSPLNALWCTLRSGPDWTTCRGIEIEIDGYPYRYVDIDLDVLATAASERSLLSFVGPAFLWASDRSWLVVAPYDAYSTYVAGDANLAHSLTAGLSIETARVRANDPRCWELGPSDLGSVSAGDEVPRS